MHRFYLFEGYIIIRYFTRNQFDYFTFYFAERTSIYLFYFIVVSKHYFDLFIWFLLFKILVYVIYLIDNIYLLILI